MSICIVDAPVSQLSELASLRASFWRDQATKGLREPAPVCSVEDSRALLGRPRTHVLVALEQDRLIGYLLGQTKMVPGPGAQRVSTIEEILTAPSVRRRGVARKLVENILARFEVDRADRIQLRVLENNSDAKAFWREFGFGPYVTIFERSEA